MLYSIEITIQNSRIEIHDIDYLDLEVTLTADGGIEQILIDGKAPSEIESIVVQDNIRKIQNEIAWRWYEDQKYSSHPLWAEM